MKYLRIILPLLLFSIYLFYSLASLSESTKIDEDGFFKIITKKKNNTNENLLVTINPERFDRGVNEQILNKKIVLDTMVVGLVYKNNEYFIKAVVNTNYFSNVYAELKCEKDLIKIYETMWTNNIYLTATISRIEKCCLEADLETIDGKTISIDLGEQVLLMGECLALLESPLLPI